MAWQLSLGGEREMELAEEDDTELLLCGVLIGGVGVAWRVWHGESAVGGCCCCCCCCCCCGQLPWVGVLAPLPRRALICEK